MGHEPITSGSQGSRRLAERNSWLRRDSTRRPTMELVGRPAAGLDAQFGQSWCGCGLCNTAPVKKYKSQWVTRLNARDLFSSSDDVKEQLHFARRSWRRCPASSSSQKQTAMHWCSSATKVVPPRPEQSPAEFLRCGLAAESTQISSSVAPFLVLSMYSDGPENRASETTMSLNWSGRSACATLLLDGRNTQAVDCAQRRQGP